MYDQQYGAPLARRFYQTKPPTILDAPAACSGRRSTFPIPKRRSGARGVGEAPVGAGFGAVVNAIAAAVGDDLFRRAPVTADMILTALEAGTTDARAVDGERVIDEFSYKFSSKSVGLLAGRTWQMCARWSV